MGKTYMTRKAIASNLEYAPSGLGISGPVSNRTRRRAEAKFRRKAKKEKKNDRH